MSDCVYPCPCGYYGDSLKPCTCAPVVTEEFASGTPEMANRVANALKNYKIIMLRGHGSFAIGQTLDEALLWTSILEEASQIMLFTKLINEPFIEYRRMSESYNKF
jgi:L-fuculose-phosphate aldolase